MVINHLEKLLVTNDAATILRELEVSLDDFVTQVALLNEASFIFQSSHIMKVSHQFLVSDVHRGLHELGGL